MKITTIKTPKPQERPPLQRLPSEGDIYLVKLTEQEPEVLRWRVGDKVFGPINNGKIILQGTKSLTYIILGKVNALTLEVELF